MLIFNHPEVVKLAKPGASQNIIAAIKLLRDRNHGMTLREAKNIVEAYREGFNDALRLVRPRSKQEPHNEA
jgi:ribosomal protein L7/L12